MNRGVRCGPDAYQGSGRIGVIGIVDKGTRGWAR